MDLRVRLPRPGMSEYGVAISDLRCLCAGGRFNFIPYLREGGGFDGRKTCQS